MVFARVDGVFEAEINRVEAHRAGDLFEVAVERPIALRHAITAERARGRGVGVDHVRVEADVGRLAIFAVADVERHRLVACVARDGQRMTAVRARIGQRVHRVGRDGAILLDACLHLDAHGVARARSDKFLVAGIFIQHGALGGNRQVRGHIFHQDFLLAAEAAADARLDHADALDGQAQHGRHHPAHVERNLRGGADNEAVVLVPVGDNNVRLDVRLLHLGH